MARRGEFGAAEKSRHLESTGALCGAMAAEHTLNRAGRRRVIELGLAGRGVTTSRPALLLYSLATAWVIHRPCLVVFNQEVENFLRSQLVVSVERDGRVGSDGECVADVRFLAQLYELRVVRRGNAQAVFVAADEEIVLHTQSPRICIARHPNPGLARFRLGFCFVFACRFLQLQAGVVRVDFERSRG